MSMPALFVDTSLTMKVNKKDRSLTIDRTVAIDSVKRTIDEHRLLLPIGAKEKIPLYYSHLTAPTRILQIDENRPDRSRYVWMETTPDHYMFAEVYCRLADMLAPYRDVFELYEDDKKRRDEPEQDSEITVPKNLRVLSPEQYVKFMRDKQLRKLRDTQTPNPVSD